MDNTLLLSPIDGRYHKESKELSKYLSESALIYYRIYTELKWIEFLAKNISQYLPTSQAKDFKSDLLIITKNIKNIDKISVLEVKKIEQTTNHDIKAIEYYLKELLRSQGCSKITLAMIHFACTSEDINNIAYALMLKESLTHKLGPILEDNIKQLKQMSLDYNKIAMLSRTHGQPASPTTLGKELAVFIYRLTKQYQDLKNKNIWKNQWGCW